MDKFRWAYIGSGNIANSTARSILKGNHCITAVYSRNQDKAISFAKKHDAKAFASFEDMIESDEFDAVYIATPHTSHVYYAVACMDRGLPVLCEKPVGVTVNDVDTLINSARNYNTYFVEAMWTWFSPVAKQVKHWIDNDEIGDVTNVVINYAFPGLMMSKDSRVLTPSTAGGALLDIGIYPITYCYNLFGYPKAIKCKGEISNGIDVAETVILSYDGFDCTLNMSLKVLKEDCKIVGTKGEIKLPMFHMASKAVMKNGKKTVFRGKTDYLTEFNCVAEEIKNGKKESDYIPFESTRACMQIMDECRREMNLVYPFEIENK